MKGTRSVTTGLGLSFIFFLLCLGFAFMPAENAEAVPRGDNCWYCDGPACMAKSTGWGWSECDDGGSCILYGQLISCEPE